MGKRKGKGEGEARKRKRGGRRPGVRGGGDRVFRPTTARLRGKDQFPPIFCGFLP